MSLILTSNWVSESSGGLGLPRYLNRIELIDRAVNPLASGVPTVSTDERWVGGLHDASASGGPTGNVATEEGSADE